ncbi:MAG TPA: hypothetical protein VKR58_14725, partial [Aquella sp.]|nr:hypothetical protein [Aquella sp.]
MHSTTIVKVNAPIDVGVARLVEAFNISPLIQTIDSCEDDGILNKARVTFLYKKSVDDLFQFVKELAIKLADLNYCCGYLLSIEWLGDCNVSG